MKKVLFSLLLVTGSYAAMAQSDAKLLDPVKVFGTPATVNMGIIMCGRDPGLCCEVGRVVSPQKEEKFQLKVYLNEGNPLEIEARKVTIVERNGRHIIKFEE